jgi:threonine/homoserine/homoserine lactone efflux protein
MELEALGWLLSLLFIGLVTPGPNNITCTIHSALHGRKSNIPLIGGMAIGFFIVHIICGFTVEYFSEQSTFSKILNYGGLLFIIILGLGVIALGWSGKANKMPESLPQIGMKGGILMQFVNGKEWFMVFTVMATVLDGFGGGLIGILSIASITVTGGLSAMIGWTFFGSSIQHKLTNPLFTKVVFTTLGGLLIILGLILSLK